MTAGTVGFFSGVGHAWYRCDNSWRANCDFKDYLSEGFLMAIAFGGAVHTLSIPAAGLYGGNYLYEITSSYWKDGINLGGMTGAALVIIGAGAATWFHVAIPVLCIGVFSAGVIKFASTFYNSYQECHKPRLPNDHHCEPATFFITVVPDSLKAGLKTAIKFPVDCLVKSVDWGNAALDYFHPKTEIEPSGRELVKNP